MSNPYAELTYKIQRLTSPKLLAIQDNAFKETLRELKHALNDVWYLDPNGEKIRVHVTTGKMDRVTGKKKQENTLILPSISINEVGVNPSESRRKTGNLLVSETKWNDEERRAQRILSLPAVPIDMSYEINIWAKYVEDLDMIRLSVFSLFNPDLTLRTKHSDLTRAFIESESDISDYQATDTEDRVLKKSISVTAETYLSTPKFLYTNTGEIKSFNFEINIDESGSASTTEATTTETVSGTSTFDPEAVLNSLTTLQRLSVLFELLKYTVSKT